MLILCWDLSGCKMSTKETHTHSHDQDCFFLSVQEAQIVLFLKLKYCIRYYLFSHNLDDLAKITETFGLGVFCLISAQAIMGLNNFQKWKFSHILKLNLLNTQEILLTSVFFLFFFFSIPLTYWCLCYR